jgi:AP-3 complex subunit delta-1
LRQHNLAVKTNAVTKLTYLQMLGYDISWASFNIIEVMSSTRFTEKRIGYLSACQSFHQDTEVRIVSNNLEKHLAPRLLWYKSLQCKLRRENLPENE